MSQGGAGSYTEVEKDLAGPFEIKKNHPEVDRGLDEAGGSSEVEGSL